MSRIHAIPNVGFNPQSLPLTGYWRAPYRGQDGTAQQVHLPGVPSQGLSGQGGTNFLIDFFSNAHDPTIGPSVSGFPPVTIGNSGLVTNGPLSRFVGTKLGSGWVLFKFTGTNNLFADYNHHPASVTPSLRVDCTSGKSTSAQVRIVTDTTNFQATATRTPVSGRWYLLCWYFDIVTAKVVACALNGDAFATTTTSTATIITPTTNLMDIGVPDAGSFPGTATTDILEIAVTNVLLTQTQFDQVLAYCRARYPEANIL
jgi:hypothetical protein